MIPIQLDQPLSFEQPFSIRKVISVKAVNRYTDGRQYYAQITLVNGFHQPAHSLKLEVLQMNDRQQLLKKEWLTIPALDLPGSQQKVLPDVIPILEETHHLSIRMIDIAFDTIECKDGVWVDGFELDEFPYQKVKHKQGVVPLPTVPSVRWILGLAGFMVILTMILVMAFFQYGLL